MSQFPNAANPNEPLEKVLKRREERIKRMFFNNGFEVRLIGDPQKPAIIIDDTYILSGYVHNFNFHFTSKPFGGEIIKTIKLHANPEVAFEEIKSLLVNYEHRHAWKIALYTQDQLLYLVGYNYLNRDQKEGRYPVFARHNPKIYFTQEKAEEVSAILNEENYETFVC